MRWNVGLAEVALQHGRLLGVPLIHLLRTLGLSLRGLHRLPVGKGPGNRPERFLNPNLQLAEEKTVTARLKGDINITDTIK